MPAPAVRQNFAPADRLPQSEEPSLKAVEAAGETVAHPSPARILQERLQSSEWATADAAEVTVKRWPLYVSLPFWLGLSGLMWAGIIAGVLVLIHHH